jgi:hypothetical protein
MAANKKEDKIVKCGTCNVGVGAKECGIMCELCDGWFHASCQDVTREGYKALQEITTSHWFCAICDARFGKVMPTIVKLSDRVELVEREMQKWRSQADAEMVIVREDLKQVREHIKQVREEIGNGSKKGLKETETLKKTMTDMELHIQTDLGKLRTELHKIKHEIGEEIKKDVGEDIKLDLEEQKLSFADVVAKHVDTRLGTVSTELEDVQKNLSETKRKAYEERDKEERRNNVILYRVVESEAATAQERNKEDKEFCLELLNDVLKVETSAEDLERVFRLGKKDDKVRPLMIQLGDRHLKNMIMESVSKLRNAGGKFRGIVVAHDMTKNEREECAVLVKEAKQKADEDQSGEYLYRVRGQPGQMKIIKIRRVY